MEYRQLGRSGLRISALTLGTMTFGGSGGFAKVGRTDVGRRAAHRRPLPRRRRQPDRHRRRVLGRRLRGDRRRRDRGAARPVLVATKARFRMGEGQNDGGLSRQHLIRACEASLRRLGIDHIDLYQVHEWDGLTPVEETLEALDTLVRQGKVRYIGCSNFSGWHLMKSLAVSERAGPAAVRQPADPLHAAGARGRVRAAAGWRSTRASACSSGARSRAACCRASTRAGPASPGGTRHTERLERAAGARRGGALAASSTC